jgi:hypothetical protein
MTILAKAQPESPQFQYQIITLTQLIMDKLKNSPLTATSSEQDRINQARMTIISELLMWYVTEVPDVSGNDARRNLVRTFRVAFVSIYPQEKARFGEDVFVASWKNLMSICDTLKLPKGNLPEQ